MEQNNIENEETSDPDDDQPFEGDVFGHLKKEDLQIREITCDDVYTGK